VDGTVMPVVAVRWVYRSFEPKKSWNSYALAPATGVQAKGGRVLVGGGTGACREGVVGVGFAFGVGLAAGLGFGFGFAVGLGFGFGFGFGVGFAAGFGCGCGCGCGSDEAGGCAGLAAGLLGALVLVS